MAVLDVEDVKLVEDCSEWITGFIETRFVGSLTPEWRATISDMLMEAFVSGAAWAEENITMGTEIIAAKHAPKIELVKA